MNLYAENEKRWKEAQTETQKKRKLFEGIFDDEDVEELSEYFQSNFN